MDRFFKKGNGTIITANANHDIKSLEDRFEECDSNGNKIKKVAIKAKKGGK